MLERLHMKVFDPILSFNITLNLGRITAIAIFLGGLLGFLLSYLPDPVYEATVRIYLTVDTTGHGDQKIIELIVAGDLLGLIAGILVSIKLANRAS